MSDRKIRQARIEDLSALGHELSDESLRLVSGGARKLTAKATYKDGSRDAEADFEWTF